MTSLNAKEAALFHRFFIGETAISGIALIKGNKNEWQPKKPKQGSKLTSCFKLLEESGWRFFDDDKGKANIVLEPNVKLKKQQIDDLGENFEKSTNGFIDFLLLDEKGFPLVVLEAKAEDKNPLIGKEQARTYARSQNCRFVILSNGNLHYFWDLAQGNPHIITKFPAPESIKTYHRFQPSSERLVSDIVGRDYLALTQMPNYADAAGWKKEAERCDWHGSQLAGESPVFAL